MEHIKTVIICGLSIMLSSCWFERFYLCKYFFDAYDPIRNTPILRWNADDNRIRCILHDNIMYSYGSPEYISIAEELGHTGYEKLGDKTVTGAPERGYYALYQTISAIEITSDIAWDEKHEAGASLADCFDISYVSFAEYIDSRYDVKKIRTVDKLITKPLTELSENDLRLIRTYGEQDFALDVTSLPTSEKLHNLSIIFHIEDGTTRERTIEVEFP